MKKEEDDGGVQDGELGKKWSWEMITRRRRGRRHEHLLWHKLVLSVDIDA